MRHCLCTLLLLAIISPIYAERFYIGDFYYHITSDTEYTVELEAYFDSDVDTVIIPESVTYQSINYSVTSIGSAFSQCKYLTSISIPNTVTSIGTFAFDGCSSLASITIPNSVTSIDWQAFFGCSSLTKTNYLGDIAGWCKIELQDNPIKYSHNLFINDIEIKDLVIPEIVDSINYSAFYECFSLNSVTIPSSVKSIDSRAFYNCCFLKMDFINHSSLDAKENEYWGALVGETEIDSLIIEGTTVVGCKKNIATVTIPNYIDSIGVRAFASCSSLASVNIPNSVTKIGKSAFEDCSSLASVNIPNSVTKIGRLAFEDCSSLVSINIPNGLIKIENATFLNCSSLVSVTIPNSVDSIAYQAFKGCASLTSIFIPDGVTYIGSGAFQDCSSLVSVNLPNSLTSIRTALFAGCSSLDSINIPDSVTNIGKSAFEDCSTLTSVNIPESVTNISVEAFLRTGIYEDESNWVNNELYIDNCLIESYTKDDDVYTIKEGIRLIAGYAFYGRTIKQIIFPNSVKSISEYAFFEADISSLEIPNSIKNIESGAFYNCRKLSSVKLGEGLTSIESAVFSGCSSLISITIPNSVTSIEKSAFNNCSSLASITIPNSVTSVGDYAFYDCTSLDTIVCLAMEPPMLSSTAFNNNKNPTLYVPCDALSAYQANAEWGQFANIKCIDSDNVNTESVIVTPSDNNVTITWPTESGADTYTIVIRKGDEVFCTLTFNSDGQLLTIALAPSREGSRPAQYAEQEGMGYRFTILGLSENTTYEYDISANDVAGNVIKTYSGEFTTQGNVTTDVDQMETSTFATHKILRNGHLIIECDGKEYTIMGCEIE